MATTREGPTYRKAPRKLGGMRGAAYRDLYTDTHCTTTPARPFVMPKAKPSPVTGVAATVGFAVMAFAFTWIVCYMAEVIQ